MSLFKHWPRLSIHDILHHISGQHSIISRARRNKFFAYYKPYRSLLVADLVCASILGVIALALPILIRHVAFQATTTSMTPFLLFFWASVMLFLVVIYAACDVFVSYYGHIMGALMEADMRQELFDHCQQLSCSFYDTHQTGDLITRITHDTFNISELYHHGPEDVVLSVIKCAGTIVILSSIHTTLSLILVGWLVIMGVYGYYFSQKMHRALSTSRKTMGNLSSSIENSLAGIRVTKAFTAEKTEQANFANNNQTFFNTRKAVYHSETWFYTGLETMPYLMTISVVIMGAWAVNHHSLAWPDLMTFLMYLGVLIEPIKKLNNFIRLYQEGITGFTRVMDILETPTAVYNIPHAIPLERFSGSIEFRDISFSYNPNTPLVLKNISLTIRAGECVAIVGPSGAGKSTIASLLLRFYQPDQGFIMIDGCPIEKYTQESLRQIIGIVQQDAYLFSSSVRDNIAYGSPHLSDGEIVKAAQQAYVHDVIMALPDGYDTILGQRGVTLSGGQRQRLCMARVFAKNPPILILDEATSSLDNHSEHIVQQSLEALALGRTTIVIAHRLSSVKHAQRILVMNHGMIQEQGTHNELLQLQGLYASLYHSQFGFWYPAHKSDGPAL